MGNGHWALGTGKCFACRNDSEGRGNGIARNGKWEMGNGHWALGNALPAETIVKVGEMGNEK